MPLAVGGYCGCGSCSRCLSPTWDLVQERFRPHSAFRAEVQESARAGTNAKIPLALSRSPPLLNASTLPHFQSFDSLRKYHLCEGFFDRSFAICVLSIQVIKVVGSRCWPRPSRCACRPLARADAAGKCIDFLIFAVCLGVQSGKQT